MTGDWEFVLINTDFLWLAGLDEVSDRVKVRIVVLLVAQLHSRSALDTDVLAGAMFLLLQVAAPLASQGVAISVQVLHCILNLLVHGGLRP